MREHVTHSSSCHKRVLVIGCSEPSTVGREPCVSMICSLYRTSITYLVLEANGERGLPLRLSSRPPLRVETGEVRPKVAWVACWTVCRRFQSTADVLV